MKYSDKLQLLIVFIQFKKKELFQSSLETPYISGKILHEGILLHQINQSQILELTIELYEDRLVSYTNPNKQQLFGIIGLKDGVKLEFSDLENQDDDEIQFIYFQKKNRFSVLFCESVIEFQKWVDFLKPKCILSNFQQYYTFKKVIGKGTFAKVVLCSNLLDKKDYAVKVFEKSALKSSKDPKLSILGLQNELNIMQEIQHPNVIKLYEVYEGHKHVYIVLELLTGGELFKKICDDDNFSESTVRNLMRNLLQALEYLHAKRIMHRDIKPENIIIKKKDGDISDIILADFGLSEHLDKKNFLFKRCGTPGYVAPEILADEPYDTQADVFSAGIIMYILLTGMSTFYGESYMEILNKNKQCIINFEFKKLGCNLSQKAEELLRLLLKRNQKERITVSQALQHPWFKVQSDSQGQKIHHDAMEKLLQQQLEINNFILILRHQLIKTTKPSNITDSQNMIQNSPLMTGVTSALQSRRNSYNNSPNQSTSPKNIISPLQQEKKSRFAPMQDNMKKMNQNQYDVGKLKEKIKNPSKEEQKKK